MSVITKNKQNYVMLKYLAGNLVSLVLLINIQCLNSFLNIWVASLVFDTWEPCESHTVMCHNCYYLL